MTSYSTAYTAYLESAAWCEKRTEALRRAGWRCERCKRVMGRGNRWLQVHHKTYDCLGHESPADLEVLCADCHKAADEKRRAATAARRLSAWAVRKYGEHWQDVYDLDDIEDEFNDWLERQSMTSPDVHYLRCYCCNTPWAMIQNGVL